MQITSEAYKTEQEGYLRNQSFVYVYLGVISREAQACAESSGSFTEYSDETSLFGNVNFEAYYATAEEDMARCDGSQYFLPRDSSAFALYQGLVTQTILGTVTFTFGDYTSLNIKGLTIDFGDFYPTSFTITNGTASNTYTYSNDSPGEWTTDDEFLGTEFIKITVHSMVGGQQRLRILSILFGLGFLFDNKSLISTSWKSEVAHLSDALPARTFSFTIDNSSRNFSSDNPHSFVAFLEEQQEVVFEYGRELDDGTIYRIPGGTLNLNSWSSNDQQAKFTAVGYLDYSTDTYNKGQYYEDGVTLYDLAVAVCQDAGYSSYIIDSYLKELTTHNPLPVDKHKNLLQLIANASMAIFRETRDGVIEIKTSFDPDITSITSSGQTDYTNLDNLVDSTVETIEYATTEQDFVYADGHQYFIPRDPDETAYLDVGYVSSGVSNEDGIFEGTAEDYLHFVYDDGTITGITFTGKIDVTRGFFYADGLTLSMNESTVDNPHIIIEWEASWTFFNLVLQFADVYPSEIMIYTYKDSAEVERFTVEDDISLETTVNHDFYDIDMLLIEFVTTNPYQRIHLSKVLFGSVADYSIDYRDMSTSPTSVRTDFVKNINVVYTEFAYGDESKSISTISVVEGENTYSSNTAHHDYSLAYKELTDDEETYTKVAKKFVDALPSAEDAKSSTRYLVPTGTDGEYYMYIVETTDGVSSWTLMATVTESIVDELPETLTENVLYLVTTDTDLIYHLYMLYNDGETTETISLGYDVRGTLTITESYAYYLVFTSTVASPVVISGTEFTVTEVTYTNQQNEVGTDKTLTNELIDTSTWAAEESEWLADYYSNDVEYTIQYRGEPALDPDDLIYIENQFVEKNLIRITDTQIDTSTGMSMSCVLHGRRISYEES